MFVTIDSSRRISNSTSSSQFAYNLDAPYQNVKALRLASVILPLSVYNVNSNNNHIDYTDTGSKTVTITPGQYSISSLVTAVQTAMNAAGSAVYTVTFNSITNKVTFAIGSGSVSFQNGTGANAATSLARVLGFLPNIDTVGAASVTPPNCVDMTAGLRNCNIYISELGSNMRLQSSGNNLATFTVPITSPFGSIQYYSERDWFQQFKQDVGQLSTLHITLYQPNSNVVFDLNGVDWSLTLEVITHDGDEYGFCKKRKI